MSGTEGVGVAGVGPGVRLPAAVERVVAELAGHPAVRRIWLFGSRARGDARERSDVDLAVEAPGATARDWAELCEVAERAETLLPIDLVRMETAGLALVERIVREGRVLHER